MFNDSPVNVVGFSHIDTQIKGKTDVSSQFTGVMNTWTEDKSCCTMNMKTIETQTNEIFNIDTGDVDTLKDCLENGLQILKTKCKGWPKITNNFESANTDQSNDNTIEVPLKQHLSFGSKKISALNWNCSGDRLIIATGDSSHVQGCNHVNFVFVYLVNNLEKDGNTVHSKFEIISCVTCLGIHPTNKHLITAGLYNGQLVLCTGNYTNDNMTTVSFEWHLEAITELLWFVRSDQQVILVTASRDGYVCIGLMMDGKIKLTQQVCRYLVGVPEKVGIQCFDYSDRYFLAALENGSVSSYLCETLRDIKDELVTSDAIKVKTYNGCSMIVESIKFSYKNSNKFAITQFDNTILLYDVYKRDPQNIIFNSKLITKLCWSLDSEFILFIGEESGELTKINLMNVKTDLKKKITNCNLALISINPLRKNMIAIGTRDGQIYISKFEKNNYYHLKK